MSAGKGSSPRSCFSQEYRENYDEIFGKKLPQRRRGAEEEKKDRDPGKKITDEIWRIIDEEPDCKDSHAAVANLMRSFWDLNPPRLCASAREHSVRTVDPHPVP